MFCHFLYSSTACTFFSAVLYIVVVSVVFVGVVKASRNARPLCALTFFHLAVAGPCCRRGGGGRCAEDETGGAFVCAKILCVRARLCRPGSERRHHRQRRRRHHQLGSSQELGRTECCSKKAEA